jgi:hypothetical protein
MTTKSVEPSDETVKNWGPASQQMRNNKKSPWQMFKDFLYIYTFYFILWPLHTISCNLQGRLPSENLTGMYLWFRVGGFSSFRDNTELPNFPINEYVERIWKFLADRKSYLYSVLSVAACFVVWIGKACDWAMICYNFRRHEAITILMSYKTL